MRKLVLASVILLASTSITLAQVYVDGYQKKDGTYVQPHYRSAPNNTALDNYSTKGNVNPYTGQPGTKNPYASGNSYLGGGSSSSGGMYGNPYSSGGAYGQKKGGGLYGGD